MSEIIDFWNFYSLSSMTEIASNKNNDNNFFIGGIISYKNTLEG